MTERSFRGTRRQWFVLRGYLFAVGINLLALGLTYLSLPLFGSQPYPLFIVGIGLSAWLFGFGPGLFSTLLALLATTYFFTPPLYQLAFTKEDALNLLLFMLVTAVGFSLMRIQRLTLETRAQLGAIVAFSDDAIIGLELDGSVASWNAGAEKVFGYSAGEVVGAPLWIIIPPERQGEGKEMLGRVAKGETYRQVELGLLHKTGRPIDTSITVSPIRSSSGKVTHASLIARDITERKRAEAENLEKIAHIAVQHRLLEQREQERLQISRDIHDGPVQDLLGITFTLESLADDVSDAQVSRTLRGIRQDIQNQISELRAFAQELRPPTLTKFGLDKTICSHLDAFQEKYPHLQVEWTPEFGEEQLREDVTLTLFRIYQEAMNNIAKHAQATHITVRARRTGRELSLEIQDDGIGFSVPGDWLALARQSHLGLVGMRERAEAAGGNLTIHSTPGKGTLLCATIPLRPPGEAQWMT